MYDNRQTLAAAALAAAAVYNAADAYLAKRKLRKALKQNVQLAQHNIQLCEAVEPTARGMLEAQARVRTLAMIMDRHEVELDEFDKIALTLTTQE